MNGLRHHFRKNIYTFTLVKLESQRKQLLLGKKMMLFAYVEL